MRTLTAFLLIAAPAFATPDDDAVAVAIAIAKAKSTPVTVDMNPKAVDPNFARSNITWDNICGRYLSADGRYAAEPKGAWQLRQWRTEPQYRTERRVVGKQCHNGICTPVYGDVRVRLPDRRVEVFAEPPAANLSPDQQPTPMPAIGAALRALNPRGKPFVDIGCGVDCRAGIAAVRDYGAAWVIAIEIDPEVAASARRYVAKAGLSDKIDVIAADAVKVDFPAGSVGFGYLWPDTLASLQPKIKKLDRFASYAHEVPGLPMRQVGDVYVYERPRPQPVVTQLPRHAGAVYGGRIYTRPVCNNPRCGMCASIRSQLAVR